MKSKKLLSSLLAVSMIASFALVGCGNDEEGASSNGGNTESGVDANQYLNLLLGSEPKTIDPSKSTDNYSSMILTNTQECLTRIVQDENGNDKIIEGIAESWEKSEDGLTWTFHLRDAKWSDGQDLTAEQFEYGIKRTLAPETASKYSFLLYPIANAQAYNKGEVSADEVGVKAIDSKTVEFKLGSQCPYFLDLTYFKVMQPQRKDIIEKSGDIYGTEAETMVFSGPFVMDEWVHNNKVILSKNENYWDKDNVKLEKVTMKVISETNARMQELYSGSIDMAGVAKPEWIEKLNGTGQFQVKDGYNGDICYSFFNQAETIDGEKNIFSNLKVRQAFSLAQSREEKIATLRKGLAEAAYSFVPPKVQIGGEDFRDKVNSSPLKELKDQNPDPKALLIEGLKELGLGDDPSKIEVTYLFSGTDADSKEWAEFEQQNFEQTLGIKMNIEYVEWAVYDQRVKNGEYQYAAQAWTGDYNDPNTFLDFWVSTAGIMPTGWKNEEYDKCIDDAAKTDDAEERAKLFKRAEEILVKEDAVCSPESWRFRKTYIRNYVKNYSAPLFPGAIDLKYTYTSGRK